MDEELLQAKSRLYYLLLKKNVDDLTDNELEIMCQLARDKQIQGHLQTSKNKKE